MIVAQLPPIPDTIPIITETSNSHDQGPEHHGIDPATQWWTEVVRRPRFGDALARVIPPGATPGDHFLSVILASDDLDDAEITARYAIEAARLLVRLTHDVNDADAMAALRVLLGSRSSGSSTAWHKAIEWVDAAQASGGQDVPALDL